jgi:uridine kinase
MNQRIIKVKLNGQDVEAPVNTSIAELLAERPHAGEFPPLGAIVNNQLSGLGRRLRGDSTVTTVDQTSKAGAEIFRRTAVLLLTRAVENVAPECRLTVGQSIANGYFFQLRGRPIEPTLVKAIEDEMARLRNADTPIKFAVVPIEEAIRNYEALGLTSKADILRIRRESEVLVAFLDGRMTFPYGPLATRTGVIQNFSLIPYEDGVVLRFPDRRGRPVRRLSPQPRLFGAFRESLRWNEVIGVSNLSEFNRALIAGKGGHLIRLAEGLHEKKIVETADTIANRRPAVRLIVISGPSSSGKTTFSKRLEIQLRVNGIEPVTLSLDNYYLAPEESPKHPDGRPDFEHLEALDLPLLNDQLQRLIAGELVQTPIFDFNTHRRKPTKTAPMQLRREQVLVLEGIHALNPRLTENIDKSIKFKIFVSALTQLMIDEHNRVFTADTRLLRRIVRDRLYRGYSAQNTIEMWDSVRLGEQRWIFPFQEDADLLFNSALIYEDAVLTTYAKRFLMEVPRESPSFVDADRLLGFLDLFIPILPEEVPGTSVLREFIGGSVFNY